MIVSAPEIKEPGGAHWYTAAGEPMHEVDNAKGDGKRATTLRDARKLGLMPSVTAVLKIAAKPALERWKVIEALKAAYGSLHLSVGLNETTEQYVERIRAASEQQVKEARDTGRAIHAAIESYYKTDIVDSTYAKHIHGVIEAIGCATEGRLTEMVFSCDLGYGGQIDLVTDDVGFTRVDDFKTKDFDESKTGKDLAYPENAMQLAAYARGLGVESPRLRNVFISRTVPGLVVTHEWPPETYEDALQKFLALLNYWQRSKNYFPTDALQTGQDVLGDRQQSADKNATVIDGNVIYQGDAQLASYGESPRAGRWVRLALDDVHTEGDPLVPFRQLNGDVLKVTVSTQDIGV